MCKYVCINMLFYTYTLLIDVYDIVLYVILYYKYNKVITVYVVLVYVIRVMSTYSWCKKNPIPFNWYEGKLLVYL